MSDNYPALPEGMPWTLEMVLLQIQQDPEWLDASPYSPDEFEALEKLVEAIGAGGDQGGSDEEEIEEVGKGKWARLEHECGN